MSKEKSLNAVIQLEIYPFDIMISFNETNEKFVENLGKYNLDSGDYKLIRLADKNTKTGRTVMTPQNHTMLRLNFYPKTNRDYAILQHEIFHVTDFILHRIGMKLSRKSDEAYAYLIEYLTHKIYDLT